MNSIFPKNQNHHKCEYHVNSGKKRKIFFLTTLRMSFWTRKINTNILVFCLPGEILLRPALVKATLYEGFFFASSDMSHSSKKALLSPLIIRTTYNVRNNYQPILFPSNTSKGNRRKETPRKTLKTFQLCCCCCCCYFMENMLGNCLEVLTLVSP